MPEKITSSKPSTLYLSAYANIPNTPVVSADNAYTVKNSPWLFNNIGSVDNGTPAVGGDAVIRTAAVPYGTTIDVEARVESPYDDTLGEFIDPRRPWDPFTTYEQRNATFSSTGVSLAQTSQSQILGVNGSLVLTGIISISVTAEWEERSLSHSPKVDDFGGYQDNIEYGFWCTRTKTLTFSWNSILDFDFKINDNTDDVKTATDFKPKYDVVLTSGPSGGAAPYTNTGVGSVFGDTCVRQSSGYSSSDTFSVTVVDANGVTLTKSKTTSTTIPAKLGVNCALSSSSVETKSDDPTQARICATINVSTVGGDVGITGAGMRTVYGPWRTRPAVGSASSNATETFSFTVTDSVNTTGVTSSISVPWVIPAIRANAAISLSANANNVKIGTPVTLSWSISGYTGTPTLISTVMENINGTGTKVITPSTAGSQIYTIAAQNAEGFEAHESITITAVNWPAPSGTVTASKDSFIANEDITVSWAFSNLDVDGEDGYVTLDIPGSDPAVTSDIHRAATGSVTVSWASAGSKTITAIGNNGRIGQIGEVTTTVTKTVTVVNADAPNGSISVSNTNLPATGSSITTSWNYTKVCANAGSVVLDWLPNGIDANAINKYTGTAAVSNYTEVVTTTGKYRLKLLAEDQATWFTFYSDMITTHPAIILGASLNPTKIIKGGSSTLTWDSTNATSLTVNGVSHAVDGTMTVNPSTTTTYIVVASDAYGNSSTVSPVLTVEDKPAAASISSTDYDVYPGAFYTITYSANNADSCTLEAFDADTNALINTWNVTTSGSKDFTASNEFKKNVRFKYSASGPGGATYVEKTITLLNDSGIGIVVTPTSTKTFKNKKSQFKATITGTTATGITWSCNAGSITQDGVFTAPNSTGTVSIKAAVTVAPERSMIVTTNVIEGGLTGTSEPSVRIIPGTNRLEITWHSAPVFPFDETVTVRATDHALTPRTDTQLLHVTLTQS